jgi:hypothetical protein
MAITLSTGSIIAIASTYGASKAMSAITNAAEAVATFEGGHGIIVGDYFEVTSGWDRLNGRIVRAKTVATNDVTLEGIDTSNTTKYPAGTGTGTIREVTAWTNLSQIQTVEPGGGEIQYADVTTIIDQVQKQIPTTRAAVTVSMTFFDDATLGWYATVRAASESSTATGVKFTFPNGSILVANAYWSLQTTPSIGSNQPLTAKIDLSYAAEPVRYAS